MRITIDRRLVGGALGVALLVAACGSSNGSPSPSAASTPETPATQSPAPSQAGSASASTAPVDTSSPAASSSGGPQISLSTGQAADLEAMLPSSIGSTPLQKSSFDGAQMPTSGTPIDQSNLDPVLKKYSKSISDVRFAMAVPAGGAASSLSVGAIYAVQLKGVPASEFMKDMSGMDVSASSTVSGKTVYGATASGQPFASYAYPKDDILFVILASPADAPGIIASLP